MDVRDIAIDFDKLPHNKAKQSDIELENKLKKEFEYFKDSGQVL